MTELIILGSGPSSGIPSLKCRLAGSCRVCNTTSRTNASIIVNKGASSILIDCGKHFFTQYNRYLTDYDNRAVPELLVTHAHADAIAGIDTFLMMTTGRRRIYSTADTLAFLQRTGEYLFRPPGDSRHRGYFSPVSLAHAQVADIAGIRVQAFEVAHGAVTALGFLIEERVVYVSDTSGLEPVPAEFYDREVLILDCATRRQKRQGHINLEDVKRYSEMLRPGRVVLTGMTHDIEQSEYLDGFRMGFDGMRIEWNDD